MVSQPPSSGPIDRGEAEDGAEHTLVAAARPWRHDVTDRRLRGHHQAAATEPLDRPEDDEHREDVAEPA